MPERLHKVLAQHGLGSRREIEKWMLAGRVRLNQRLAQPGDQYRPGDRVFVDGKDVTARLRVTLAPQVLVYHKAQGEPLAPVTPSVMGETPAASGPPPKSVMERLPAVRGARWLAINPMQPGDSGLLLVTNDGRLADALRRRVDTISTAYVARVLVPSPDFDVESLPRAVHYDGETLEFEDVEPAGGEGTNRWFRVKVARAHRRAAVRALFESCGLKVSRVIQVRFANVELPRDLPRGRHRALTPAQLALLYRLADLPPPDGQGVPPGPRRGARRRSSQRSRRS